MNKTVTRTYTSVNSPQYIEEQINQFVDKYDGMQPSSVAITTYNDGDEANGSRIVFVCIVVFKMESMEEVKDALDNNESY